jgi:hypothetical protein
MEAEEDVSLVSPPAALGVSGGTWIVATLCSVKADRIRSG